jgi:tol-pal system protein YbgF
MRFLYALLLLGMLASSPACAGLFTDEVANKNIQQLQERILKLEAVDAQRAAASVDLQAQLETLKKELRLLRGQNEELAHGLQDAEKREKDFYVDLDTRLRSVEASSAHPANMDANAASRNLDVSTEVADYDAADSAMKAGNQASALKLLQDFLKKYPNSSHAPIALYSLGEAQFYFKDNKSAAITYEKLLNSFPSTPPVPDTLLNLAICQQALKQTANAQKNLKQLIATYPRSLAAEQARKILASTK